MLKNYRSGIDFITGLNAASVLKPLSIFRSVSEPTRPRHMQIISIFFLLSGLSATSVFSRDAETETSWHRFALSAEQAILDNDLGQANTLYSKALEAAQSEGASEIDQFRLKIEKTVALVRAGRINEADKFYRELKDISFKKLGTYGTSVASALYVLGDEYEAAGLVSPKIKIYCLENALSLQTLTGPVKNVRATLLSRLISAYIDDSRFIEANRIYKQSLHLIDNSQRGLGKQSDLQACLSCAYELKSKISDAKAMKIASIKTRVAAGFSEVTSMVLYEEEISDEYLFRKMPNKAEQHAAQAVEFARVEPTQFNVSSSKSCLARAFYSQAKFNKACQIYKEAIDCYPKNSDAVRSMLVTYSKFLKAAHRYKEADSAMSYYTRLSQRNL